MRRDDEADNEAEDEDEDDDEEDDDADEDADMAGLDESAEGASALWPIIADDDAKVGENAETERRCRATDIGAADEMRGARCAASGPV
jgi:hypothetical protein